MTVMTISVLDAERAIHTRADASFVDVLIPALSDDPETIDELQHALRRFVPPEDVGEILAGWAAGECDRPLEAGICLVDMAARLIVYQSTEGEFQRHGKVTFGAVDEYAAARLGGFPIVWPANGSSPHNSTAGNRSPPSARSSGRRIRRSTRARAVWPSCRVRRRRVSCRPWRCGRRGRCVDAARGLAVA